jgi:HEAT repeat protein
MTSQLALLLVTAALGCTSRPERLLAELRTSDSEQAVAVADRLTRLGPKVIPQILAFVNDNPDHQLARASAIYAIGQMHSQANEAVPTLVEILRSDGDDVTRSASAGALGEIGSPYALPAVPALTAALNSPEWSMLPLSAARALGKLGSGATDAIPALRALANDNASVDVRKEAESALAAISGN